jgi:hypothetical protein
MARFSALENVLRRWGHVLVIAFSGLVLVGGLGSTGLWEPWEMDRADLARTLAGPPEVVVALGPEREGLATSVSTAAAVHEAVVKRPDTSISPLRGALDFARNRTPAAIVIDADLLVPKTDDPEAWKDAGKLSAEALNNAAGGTVVIIRSTSSPAHDVLRSKLAEGEMRAVWDDASATWNLDKAFSTENLDEAIRATAASLPENERLFIVDETDATSLDAALDAGVSAVSYRVAFKDGGKLHILPPLETWLRAAAYRAFGASEWTTRLPGAILAWLAFWILIMAVRAVFSPRIAFLTGLVLATTPLFFAQARIIAGEPSFILAITLVGSALLLSLQESSRAHSRLAWAYLFAGLITAALAKGAFGLSVAALVVLSVPLVRGSRRLSEWAPSILFALSAIALELIARDASIGSFWRGLDFRTELFSEGPSAYHRTFDMVIRALGFGMAPWSPIIAIAIGALVFTALADRDGKGLVVAAWFFLPLVAVMASLKVGNQFLFVGVGAAAIATALLLDRMLRGDIGPKYYIALALLCMFYILRRELKQSPEPLVGFLAFDPTFAKEGNLRFPETVAISSFYKFWFILATVALVFHLGHIPAALMKALRWARQTRPFIILSGIFLLLGTLFALIAIGRLHGIGMGSSYADSIQATQKALVGRLASPDDPMILMALLIAFAVLVVALGRWVFTSLGRAVSDLFVRPVLSQRTALIAFASLWLLGAVIAAFQVALPEGYLSELILGGTGLSALIGATLASALSFAVLRNRLDALLVLVAVLSLLVQTQLLRDADLPGGLSLLPIVLGFVALAITILPRLEQVEHLVFGALASLSLIGLSYVVVLLDRAPQVAEVVHATEIAAGASAFSKALGYMLNAFVFLPFLMLLAILFNAALPSLITGYAKTAEAAADLSHRIARLGESTVRVLQHRFLAVAMLIALGLIGTFTHLVSLEPAIAVNVSQKHILDAWFGDSTHGPNSMFKHGSFATQGRKDSNFYTAEVPEIRDRQTALKVLLAESDQVIEVETSRGTETLALTGYTVENDKNGDKRRDAPAVTGFASAVTGTSLTDASASWAPKSLVGKRLADASGRSWAIVDNDATTVRVADTDLLTFALTPRTSAYYVIDAPGFDSKATAEAPTRRALLLPADQLSDLNYAWRQLSGGRHLPVLDGSSYRVLLTTSWLEEGEPQQNRLALATFNDETFKNLDDPRLKRVWGTFDDTLQLVGYATDKDVVGTGDKLRLTLYFKTLKLVRKSLKLFIHMDKTGGGSRIAGDHWPLNPTRHSEDNKNCGGCYRTDHWLVGDIVQDVYDIEIPEGNTGEYMIWIGLFQPGPDTRAVVRDWDKKRARHDGSNRLGIGTVRVK